MEAPYQRDEVVDLVAGGDVAGLVDASPDVEREVDRVENPPAFGQGRNHARPGRREGRWGEMSGRPRWSPERGYEKPSLGQRLWYTVGGIFK